VDEELKERRRLARRCFGCGDSNPMGLGMRFRLDGGRAVTEFKPAAHHQGFPGHMHGGLVSTMLDEAMGWAVYGQGVWAVTARMSVRFREPVPLSEPLLVTGWVTRTRGPLLDARAEIRTRDGALLAQAEGVFMRVRGRRAEQLAQAYRGQAGQTEG
jgi:acyl-coenzyme A thioesterase PaaI-like protein